MYFYTAASESFPMSYETKQALFSLADSIKELQSALSARSIYVLANSDIICSDSFYKDPETGFGAESMEADMNKYNA